MKGKFIFLIIIIFFSLGAISGLWQTAVAAPAEVVRAHGTEFWLNGVAYRFVGVNLRGLCHYGYGQPLPYTTSAHIDENLDGVRAMGGKVVRIFAAVNNVTHQEAVNRLKIVLDKMEERGLKAIVCLTDVYGATSFHPQGDDGYYQMQPSGWVLLDDSWFAGGYTNNYLPFVQLAVTQLKDHNAIFAWELGNELTDIKNPNNIMSFTSNVAAAIKAIDPYHMVTTGFLSVDHLQIGETKGLQLYADPNIDFITVHSYNGDDPPQNRAVHSRLGKPLVVEEYGWETSAGDRVTNTQTQINKWFEERGARGFLQWGYQAQSYDIGDGDLRFGMHRFYFSDYDQLFAIYNARASQIATNPIVLPARLAPSGVNIARFSTGWQADSVYNSNYTGDRVYDGIISPESKWTSLGTPPPHWLTINLGQPRAINGITVRMSGAAGEWIVFNLRQFVVQTGNSFNGPWSNDFTINNLPQFSFVHCLYDTPKLAQYVRLYVTDCGVDNYCRLPEFEVYESQTSSHLWQIYE